VEVVLGEADRVVAEVVGQHRLLGEIRQHAVVQITSQTGAAGLDLGPAAHRREVEEGRLHDPLADVITIEARVTLPAS
jgi:hypothetical protein